MTPHIGLILRNLHLRLEFSAHIALNTGPKMTTKRKSQTTRDFLPLELEMRPTVSTAAIAFYTHSAAQTWRAHASKGTGGIVPLRLNNKLHWPTKRVRELLGVS